MAAKVRWKCSLLVLFTCVIVVNSHFESRQCNHFYPKADEVVHGVYIDHPHVIKKRNANQPLRILLWYDESVYRLDTERFQLINDTILPMAVSFWENALMVKKSENVIRLNRKCINTQIFIKNSMTYCIDKCRNQTMCGEVVVPEEHLDVCRTCNATGQNCNIVAGSKRGEGISNADFIFYVSAMQTERCNKGLTVAYAAHCQQEIALDRPIAGHANLCPESISTKPQEMETLLSTVKHEILHALGFSVSLYAFFRDSNGNPLTPRKLETGKPPLDEQSQIHQWSDKVIQKIQRPRWLVREGYMSREIHMMITPRVVEEVRNYFDCDALEGAELEDQGEDGTALTHWEKRVFENEAMTGTHTQNPVISRLTLALMEDTGWYKANYSMAEPMTWGKGLGCNFVMKSCKEWMYLKAANSKEDKSEERKGRKIHPFCNKVKRDPLQTECTDDRNAVALCNLIKHDEELPKMYQNFDELPHVEHGREGFYGGSVSLADYCPYIQEFTWRSKNISIRGSQCQYVDNTPREDKNFALESYGENSKCFEHSNDMWEERSCRQVRQWLHWGSGCYQYICRDGRLHIQVANYTYSCFHPNQKISIRIVRDGWLHKGVIMCPPCRELCSAQFEKEGKRCRLPEEPSPTVQHDDLICDRSTTLRYSNLVLVYVIVFTVFLS